MSEESHAPRTALERARRFGAALLATGVVTAGVGAGVDALQPDEHEVLVQREGGGTLMLQTAADTCWRVEAHEAGTDATDSADSDSADSAPFERRGCGASDVSLPGATVFGSVRLYVEKETSDPLADAVAMVWAGRQVLNGALVADTDTSRGQVYSLRTDSADTVLVTVDAREVELAGDFAASPGTQVTGPARRVAKKLGLDPDLRVTPIASLARTFAGRHVSDVGLLHQDMGRARSLTRSALAYRGFLEALQAHDSSALATWLGRADKGLHGSALAKRAEAFRAVAGTHLMDGLLAEAAGDGDAAVDSSTWKSRLETLDEIVDIDQAHRAEAATVRWRWQSARQAATAREEAERLAAEAERTGRGADADAG